MKRLKRCQGELADLDDCKLIPVFDAGNKLDGERNQLVRCKRSEASGLKVESLGLCFQTEESKAFLSFKGHLKVLKGEKISSLIQTMGPVRVIIPFSC